MSAIGKIAAAILGIGVPFAVLGVGIAYFSSNPLITVGAITAVLGGGIYLLTYREHE